MLDVITRGIPLCAGLFAAANQLSVAYKSAGAPHASPINIDIYAHIAPYTFFMVVKYELRTQRLYGLLSRFAS